MLIYKIIHKTGKVYIGKTDSNLAARKKQHLRLLDKGCHHCQELQDLYDQDSKLSFKTIQDVPDSKMAHEREQELIGANWQVVINSHVSPSYVEPEIDYGYEEEYHETHEIFPQHMTGPLKELREKYIRDKARIESYYK